MEHPVETIRTSIHGTEAMLELGHHKTVKKTCVLIEYGTVWCTL